MTFRIRRHADGWTDVACGRCPARWRFRLDSDRARREREAHLCTTTTTEPAGATA